MSSLVESHLKHTAPAARVHVRCLRIHGASATARPGLEVTIIYRWVTRPIGGAVVALHGDSIMRLRTSNRPIRPGTLNRRGNLMPGSSSSIVVGAYISKSTLTLWPR